MHCRPRGGGLKLGVRIRARNRSSAACTAAANDREPFERYAMLKAGLPPGVHVVSGACVGPSFAQLALLSSLPSAIAVRNNVTLIDQVSTQEALHRGPPSLSFFSVTFGPHVGELGFKKKQSFGRVPNPP